jgi:shikimate dehydrogenase
MKRACVIGWPIEQSRSPLIHGYWLKRYQVDGSYTKEAVPNDTVRDFIVTLEKKGFAGCNVTVPHKEIAYAMAEVKHASAEAVGAANTLWLEGGRLHGANTDTYGFMTHFKLSAPEWSAKGGPVSILGAGGAARAVVFGFMQAGVEEIRVFNRTRARAEELAEHFGGQVRVLDWDERSTGSRDARALVNTTTIGMKGEGALGIDFDGFRDDCVVSDIVYVPLETDFLAQARARGLRTVDGLGMLLHQAVPGFEKWFGIRPEVTDELRSLVVDDIGRA